MKLFKFIFSFISFLFHLSSTTQIHSSQYIKFLTNIRITYISSWIIKLGFFLSDIFIWFFARVGRLRCPNYFSEGKFKKRHLVLVVQRLCFRFIHRKKHRKPIRLTKVIPNLNYFGDCLISSSRLNKFFASVSTFIVYIGLLYLGFKYLNYCLKRETFKFLDTNNIKIKNVVKFRNIYYKFVKFLNTLYTINIFCIRKEIYKPIINLFSFIPIIK